MTHLPLPDGTATASAPDNTPIKMPSTKVCKSDHQANFYKLAGVKLAAAVAWYAGNLKGYSQNVSADGRIYVFSNAERSLIVIVMGDAGGDASSAAYEAFNRACRRTRCRLHDGQDRLLKRAAHRLRRTDQAVRLPPPSRG